MFANLSFAMLSLLGSSGAAATATVSLVVQLIDSVYAADRKFTRYIASTRALWLFCHDTRSVAIKTEYEFLGKSLASIVELRRPDITCMCAVSVANSEYNLRTGCGDVNESLPTRGFVNYDTENLCGST